MNAPFKRSTAYTPASIQKPIVSGKAALGEGH
jgi:hypothetical protein